MEFAKSAFDAIPASMASHVEMQSCIIKADAGHRCPVCGQNSPPVATNDKQAAANCNDDAGFHPLRSISATITSVLPADPRILRRSAFSHYS